mgnify:CR=1 FL=1
MLSFYMQDAALLASGSFVAVYATFALFFGVVWPLLYVVTPEAFPAAARASGFGFVSAFSKLGALSHPILVAFLLDRSIFIIGILFTCGWALALACAATHAMRVRRARVSSMCNPHDVHQLPSEEGDASQSGASSTLAPMLAAYAEHSSSESSAAPTAD